MKFKTKPRLVKNHYLLKKDLFSLQCFEILKAFVSHDKTICRMVNKKTLYSHFGGSNKFNLSLNEGRRIEEGKGKKTLD